MTNLLIVDDEPDLLDALATILVDAGYGVEAVTSGGAALEVLQASEGCLPDLIIADIVMAEMSGLQFFEIVRSSPDMSDIPFLFTSAFVSPEREELIARQSKAALLPKPFEVEELFEAIAAMCGPVR